MCYEMSGWFKKARAAEQQRKEVPTEKTATRETAATVMPKAAEPTKRKETEKVPA